MTRFLAFPTGLTGARHHLSRARRVVRRARSAKAYTNGPSRLADDLRWTVATSGDLQTSHVDETAGLVFDAVRRTIGLEMHPEQLACGMAMTGRAVAEMATGEGKTLAAIVPAFAFSLRGDPVHVLTANDYLAGRDAAWTRPVYEALGLTVGSVSAESSPGERRAAYACDVTYATAREAAFDFLRDRLREDASVAAFTPLQRRPAAAVIDEFDAIAVDDARTPFVIGLPSSDTRQETSARRWCERFAATLAAPITIGSTRRPATPDSRNAGAGKWYFGPIPRRSRDCTSSSCSSRSSAR